MTTKPALIGFIEAYRLIKELKRQITAIIIGKNVAVELALTAFLAQGHKMYPID